MKFLTFRADGRQQVGVVIRDDKVLSLTDVWRTPCAPTDVAGLIALGDEGLAKVRALIAAADSHASAVHALNGLTLLAPIPRPAKNVFCIGRNYRAHIEEGNRARGRDPNDFPKVIEVFTKPPTAVVGTGATVLRHEGLTNQLDYEVELGIVIGKPGAYIAREHALEHVFGYTIINDVTARDLQAAHGQWFKGKSLDTSCPIGPYVVHACAIPDPHQLRLEMSVNGEPRQDSSTSDLLFKIEDIIAQLSAGLTLEAGDIIATGTPAGVGMGLVPPRFLQKGDVMQARIEGLGVLTNTVG